MLGESRIIQYMKNVLNLKNIVWKEGDYYVALCLNVDVSSFGTTKKEALSNLDEALHLYFEDADVSAVNKIERPELFKRSMRYA